MWKPLLAAVLIAATSAAPARAQEQAPPEAVWSAVADALGPGAFVAVRLKDGKRVTGTMIRSSDRGILLLPRTRIPVSPRELAYGDIESLERTGRPRMSPGAKVMLGVGIGAGVVFLGSALIFAAAGY